MNPGKSELWFSRLKIQALYPLIHLPGSEKFHNTTILRYRYGLLYMEHFIITCSFWFKKKKTLIHKPCSHYTNCDMLIALTELLFHPWRHYMGHEGFNLFLLSGSVFKTNPNIFHQERSQECTSKKQLL